MSLLDNPIPPKPAEFTPEGAPPGIEIRFDDYLAPDGSPWYLTRPIIEPRLGVVHTNAGSREGSYAGGVGWGNSRPYNNTHAHYQLKRDRNVKMVPTDRRGIGNATIREMEEAYNVPDVSFWSYLIETSDVGSLGAAEQGIDWPTDCGPFLHDHAELVARIIAYEAIVWDIPIDYPGEWTGTGVVTHTDPFPYPYYTIKQGKTCPGATKKRQLREEVLPRARQIWAAWSGVQEEATMKIRVFKLDDGAPLFASGDGVTAIWVSQPQWRKWKQLELVSPDDIELLDRAEAIRYALLGDLPDGYAGIWANSEQR